eukprot:TRINITY_DN10882_c0_g1_i2.p2 TRINITY_DN10882_c0_g1~~TRINITY_DN10882_c0_g1_i2.p2  ORF type:complete len:126 (+),score=32.95 TRINITY_DN10882_c0_g1_i2:246-623(+)
MLEVDTPLCKKRTQVFHPPSSNQNNLPSFSPDSPKLPLNAETMRTGGAEKESPGMQDTLKICRASTIKCDKPLSRPNNELLKRARELTEHKDPANAEDCDIETDNEPKVSALDKYSAISKVLKKK